jgi:hypothetical protein
MLSKVKEKFEYAVAWLQAWADFFCGKGWDD